MGDVSCDCTACMLNLSEAARWHLAIARRHGDEACLRWVAEELVGAGLARITLTHSPILARDFVVIEPTP